MWAAEALKEWHDFYMLVGTAGATLLALLFVAVSCGTGFLTRERQSATSTFMSPVVLHFTSVFFLSAIALCPWHQAKFFAGAASLPMKPSNIFSDVRKSRLSCVTSD